jgi:hypothetical protein
MRGTNTTTDKHNRRVRTYRSHLQNQGVKRVEIRIPLQDVPLVHNIADVLRAGGNEASMLREQMHRAAGGERHTTGKDLVAFFHSSPLNDTGLELERDTATSRTLTF